MPDSYALHAYRPRGKERALSISQCPSSKKPTQNGITRGAYTYKGVGVGASGNGSLTGW